MDVAHIGQGECTQRRRIRIEVSAGKGLLHLRSGIVEPGRRIVWIGLSGTPSTVDTREIALKDVTAVGILGASAGLPGAIAAYADGSVDPRPLVAATIGLADVAAALAGHRPPDAGPGPKLLVDPRTP